MASEPGTYVFEVRSGLYRGVAQDVGEGRHVVGSGDGADFVLMEAALAPRQAAIVLQGGMIRVEGLAEGVVVEGAGEVPSGAARTVRLPATVALGGIETLWRAARSDADLEPADRSAGPLSGLRTFLRRPAVTGIAAASSLALALVLTVANPIAGAGVLLDGSAREALARIGSVAPPAAPSAAAQAPDPSAAASPRATAPTPVAAPQAAPQPARPRPPGPSLALAEPRKGSVEGAADTLRREVEQSGLLNVQVKATAGAVAATGTIEPSMAGRWETLQQGFDERFAGEVALVNSVAVKTEKLPSSLGIEGVWRGPQPYIVIRGQRYLIGAVVDGGWAIRKIERDRVMLERDGRLVAMRF